MLDIDEVDLNSVTVGQPATLILETWPNDEISGELVAIAPQAKSNSECRWENRRYKQSQIGGTCEEKHVLRKCLLPTKIWGNFVFIWRE